MDFFRSGLKSFGLTGFKMDDNTANLVANFASGGLGMALDQISRTALPSRRKDPPPPRPPCPFKVVRYRYAQSILQKNNHHRSTQTHVKYISLGLVSQISLTLSHKLCSA